MGTKRQIEQARINGLKGGHPVGKHPETLAREAARAARLAEIGLTEKAIVDELAILGFSNVADLFDASGNLKPIKDLTREQALTVSSFEVIKKNAEAGDGIVDTIHKARLWDKIKALELLGKAHGIFTEKVEHTFADFAWLKDPK